MTILAAEFFAGMGLMRAGLERCGIETVFANDIDKVKATLYQENWGSGELHVGDIRNLTGNDIPPVDIATASFPCVDLSLAGRRAGLNGTRSGVVFEFFRIIEEMHRAPQVIIIENVPGFLSNNGGRDFRAVSGRLEELGYNVAYTCIDAAAFVPQSRLRVFLLGYRDVQPLMPDPPSGRSNLRLSDIAVDDADWWDKERLEKFLSSLSGVQADRVNWYKSKEDIGHYGSYRRTRKGRAVWEVRSDEIAGALRTTQGGSGCQAMLRAGNGGISVRWMDVREYASLQGADNIKYDSVSPRQAMYAFGDAVCVPVVEWLTNHCVMPVMCNV